MRPETVTRHAMAEARKSPVSVADFGRQAIAEKLPRPGRGVDRRNRRRSDSLEVLSV
jgi:hypothetical protein